MVRKVENLLLAMVSKLHNKDHIDSMLNTKDFIQPFLIWRNKRISQGKATTGIFYDIMDYVIEECTDLILSGDDIVKTLESNKMEILHDYYTRDRGDLLTSIVSRDCMLEPVVNKIHMEARGGNIVGLSSKIDVVKNMFLEYFRKSSASTFEFGGALSAYVNSSNELFWQGHRQDIQQVLRSQDRLLLETTKNIVASKEIVDDVSGDIKIGPLLQNIHSASVRMFNHSGHSHEVHGVLSDVYYIVMVLLCEEKVEKINMDLEKEGVEYSLQFIDTYSFRDESALRDLGLRSKGVVNKGMAAKVQNAKDIIRVILRSIRSRSFRIDGMFDLCRECFDKGKRDIEGKNCVWQNTDSKSTMWSLSTDSITNYETFDIILKGVVSAYTLMTELERRGQAIAYNYVSDVFRKPELVRSVMYESDLKYIDLVQELQAQKVPEVGEGGLMSFDRLVMEVSGSVNNGHSEIKENRREAMQKGLLDGHRRKKRVVFNDIYSQADSLANVFTSLPREVTEDKTYVALKSRGIIGNAWRVVDASGIYGKSYTDFSRNAWLIDKPDIGATLVYGESSVEYTDNFGYNRWNIALAEMSGLCILLQSDSGCYEYRAVFDPVEKIYVMEGDNGKLIKEPLSEFRRIAGSRRNVSYSLVNCLSARLTFAYYGDKNAAAEKYTNALGFDTFIGLDGVDSSAVFERIGSIPVYFQYEDVARVYIYQLAELSRLQLSFVQLAEMMFLRCVVEQYDYDGRSNGEGACGSYGSLFESFLRGEFIAKDIETVIDDVCEAYGRYGRKFVTMGEDAGGKQFVEVPLNMDALEYLSGMRSWKNCGMLVKTSKGNIKIPSLRSEFDELVGETDRCGVRFVKLYNFINDKAYFLRHLRDAFEMLFCVSKAQISSLTCSVNSIFDIMGSMEKFFSGNTVELATVDGVEVYEMKDMIKECRERDRKTYDEALRAIDRYCRSCEESITNLIDYNIYTGEVVSEELDKWGRGFDIKGPDDIAISLIPEKLMIKDDNGFYKYNGLYFKGKLGGAVYYLHCTGRLLREERGKFAPYTLPLREREGVAEFERIVKSGFVV